MRLPATTRLGPVHIQHTSGLYHVAIHVPTRTELARVTARLIASRYPDSPTDHLVCEAAYPWDADGNGIEITFETPRSAPASARFATLPSASRQPTPPGIF